MSVAEVGAAPEPMSHGGLDFSAVARNSLEDERAYVTVQPISGAGVFTKAANNRITIPLPKDQRYLDVENTSFTANLSITQGGHTNASLSELGAASCIRSIVLRQVGGGEVVRMDFYNRILAQIHKYHSAQWISSVGRRFGMGTPAERQADGALAAPGRRMEVSLHAFGPMQGHLYLPLWLVAMELEFELESDAEALVSTAQAGLDPSYTIRNPTLNCELVRATEEYDAAIRAQVEAGAPVGVPIEMWRYIPATIDASDQNAQRNVSVYVQQFLTYMAYYVVQSHYSNFGFDQFLNFVDPGLSTVQVQVGSRYYPRQLLNCTDGGTEALIMLHIANFKRRSAIGAVVDSDDYSSLTGTGSQFQLAIPLGQARDAHVGAGINTKNPSANSIVLLNHAAAPASTYRLNQIAHYAAMINFSLGAAVLVE